MSDSTFEAPRYRFDEFVLDVPDRQLWRDGSRVDLNARYLDALVLLLRERGKLIGKDRFFDEVWADVVVSDSALSQCIKEIRRLLGDDASNPRYIQTVQGYGYRFIGEVAEIARDTVAEIARGSEAEIARDTATLPAESAAGSAVGPDAAWRVALREIGAGTLGGGTAGAVGGLMYGFGLASADAGVGTLSTLLVLVSLTVLAGIIGGFGVSLGLAGADLVARIAPGMRVALRIAGAAAGGLVIGATAKLLGVDAFNLLFGRAPAGITGGPEGAVLGASLALGAYVGNRLGRRSDGAAAWHAVAGAGTVGAVGGALIPLAGGRLLGGSLDLVAKSFAESRLQLDRFGAMFGEVQFGLASQVVLGAMEGLLFGAGVVGALVLLGRFGNGRADR
jgi:DNA-binding winged helix-turn-helix (wHTH) protein